MTNNHLKYLVFVLLLLSYSSWCQSSRYTVNSLKNKYNESEIYNELIRRAAQSDTNTKNKDFLIPQSNNLANYQIDTLYKYIKVIYDTDDRHNIYEHVITPELQNDANKVACLINRNQIKSNLDGTYTLIITDLFGEEYGLCDNEKFINEPIISFGSGFAISSKIFVTAGHCIDNSNLSKTLIVYGYRMKSKLEPNIIIRKEDIYEPTQIVGREHEGTSNDYALVEVKQTFPDKRIATIRLSGMIKENEKVHIVGYPSGLPIKITLDADVLNNTFSNYFVINSDSYQGNSGSPVFNSKTHIVEGILVRGEKDFHYIRLSNCYGSVRCPKDGGTCHGEDVSRVSQFLSLINNH